MLSNHNELSLVLFLSQICIQSFLAHLITATSRPHIHRDAATTLHTPHTGGTTVTPCSSLKLWMRSVRCRLCNGSLWRVFFFTFHWFLLFAIPFFFLFSLIFQDLCIVFCLCYAVVNGFQDYILFLFLFFSSFLFSCGFVVVLCCSVYQGLFSFIFLFSSTFFKALLHGQDTDEADNSWLPSWVDASECSVSHVTLTTRFCLRDTRRGYELMPFVEFYGPCSVTFFLTRTPLQGHRHDWPGSQECFSCS